MHGDELYRKTISSITGEEEFTPVGREVDQRYLPYGLWLVRKSQVTSVPYIESLCRIGEAVRPDIPTLCGLEEYVNYIEQSDEFHGLLYNGHSLDDIVRLCVHKMYEFNITKTNARDEESEETA